jgi:hypothetical protein
MGREIHHAHTCQRAIARASILAASVALLIGPPRTLASGVGDAHCLGNTDSSLTMAAGEREAQTFTAINTGTITAAATQIGKSASGGDFQLQIYPTDTLGVPANVPLGSATIHDASVRVSGGLVHADFPSPVTIQAGKQYALAVSRPVGPDWTLYDMSGNPCPGQEYYSPTSSAAFTADDPPGFDLYFIIDVKLTNVFIVGKLKGRTLHLNLPSRGRVVVRDASRAGKASATSASNAVLKTEALIRGPGDSRIQLALTGLGKRILQEKGLLKTRPAITFTPDQGDPNTVRAILRIKNS